MQQGGNNMTRKQIKQAATLSRREQELRDYELRLAKDVIWLHTLCQSIVSIALAFGLIWHSMQ
jgi:hypothetical protein